MADSAIQDLIPHNHCFGCGPDNDRGLRLKSFWDGSGISVARFAPQPHHCAGPRHFVNGGVLATILDCHGVCTATAAAYRDAGRAVGSVPHFYYATARLDITYRRPTPIDIELELRASVASAQNGSYVVSCTVAAGDKVTVEATIAAVRVPATWMGLDVR